MTLRIDYQFDASSLKKFFEPLEVGRSQTEEIADIVRVVEILEDEDISEEMIKEAQGIIARYLQTKGESEILIENYRVSDLNVFISFLEKTIKEFEELLKSRGFMSLEPLLAEEKTRLFKTKVWNEGNRFRLGMLVENTEKREFEIVLKNGFESHGKLSKSTEFLLSLSFSSPDEKDGQGFRCDHLSLRRNLEELRLALSQNGYERQAPDCWDRDGLVSLGNS